MNTNDTIANYEKYANLLHTDYRQRLSATMDNTCYFGARFPWHFDIARSLIMDHAQEGDIIRFFTNNPSLVLYGHRTRQSLERIVRLGENPIEIMLLSDRADDSLGILERAHPYLRSKKVEINYIQLQRKTDQLQLMNFMVCGYNFIRTISIGTHTGNIPVTELEPLISATVGINANPEEVFKLLELFEMARKRSFKETKA